MIKNNKKVAVAAAGLATALTLSFAAPSFAATSTDSGTTNSIGSIGSKKAKAPRPIFANVAVPVSITGIPTTVTDAHDAAHGAQFNVYVLDAAATELPATQPTTGAKVVGVHPGGGAAGTTTKLAVYPVNGGAGSLVTVTVSANGIATQASSAALTSVYVEPAAKIKPEKPGHDEAAEEDLGDEHQRHPHHGLRLRAHRGGDGEADGHADEGGPEGRGR